MFRFRGESTAHHLERFPPFTDGRRVIVVVAWGLCAAEISSDDRNGIASAADYGELDLSAESGIVKPSFFGREDR